MGRLDRLDRYDEVVAAAGGDPYARWVIDPARPVHGAARDGAVLWTVRREHYTDKLWATLLGPHPAVGALLADVVADPGLAGLDRAPEGVTVPFGAMDQVPADVRPPEYGDWVWWWTSTPPPVHPRERDVVDLAERDGARAEELTAFLREASPTASTAADDERVRTWGGIHDDGALIACGADRPYDHGVPHLASIATLPSARGQGLGSAVTAWLTRRRLVDDEAAVVTLGMYADNDAARAMYLRLGFTPEHRFTSGDLHPAAP